MANKLHHINFHLFLLKHDNKNKFNVVELDNWAPTLQCSNTRCGRSLPDSLFGRSQAESLISLISLIIFPKI